MISSQCFSGFRAPAQSCFKYHVTSFYCRGVTAAICSLFVSPWTKSECQPEKCTLISPSQNKRVLMYACVRVHTAATVCHLNSSRVAHRIKRHARFSSLASSQTEQEMRKLKINPIKNNYFLPRWMCSTCARADNTFNNPALLLICVKMLFKFSERPKYQVIQSCWELVTETGTVFTEDIIFVLFFNRLVQSNIWSGWLSRGSSYIQHCKYPLEAEVERMQMPVLATHN